MQFRAIFLILSFILFSFGACQEKESLDFSKYISGYTSGVIKSSSTISVYINLPVDKKFKVGSVLPAEILKISPAIKGEVILKNEGCIEFVPAEPFENGKTYQVRFHLGDICSVSDDFKTFGFDFEIIPLSVVFEPGNILTDAEDENILGYTGVLHSSDYMLAAEVEKILSATYQGSKLEAEWEHTGNRHRFKLRQLKKENKEQELSLDFTEAVKNNGTVKISIPGKQDFTVLDVKVSPSKPIVVSIYMSQNVDTEQEIRGLVEIIGVNLDNFKVQNNIIQVYLPSTIKDGSMELNIFPGLRSASAHTLQSKYTTLLRLQTTKPEVKLLGKGVIIPDKNKVLIPFSAVGLKAVDLEVIQVFSQNMNFFLQENSYDDRSELMRTARSIFTKKIDLLQENPNIDLGTWNNFTIDLSKQINLEKGVVYRFRLKFKKSYTILPCADIAPDSDYGTVDWDNTGNYSYYNEYHYPNGYTWKDRDNPCSVSYYRGDRFVARNIISSSLGVMAKRAADNSYVVSVSDITTAGAVDNCKVILYNFQNQKLDSVMTDKDGFGTLQSEGKAFMIIAQKEGDRAWLKLGDGNALSLSNFDVSGQHVQMGVKGFIYGERGVWRPGDEIYLSLILEDKLNVLPKNHPIVGQLIDPNGHIVQTLKSSIGENNIHSFIFKSVEDAQTGYWNAIFRVGGLTFKKTLRVETVKSNRLAIQMDFPNDKIVGKGISTKAIEVHTRWLNGAATSKQKATTEIRLYNGNKGFSTYPEYSFTDQSKYFESTTISLFDGTTDEVGSFSFGLNKIQTDNAPGVLNAIFTTRAFENGGDFSISSQSMLYSPYSAYVGIRLPESKDGWYSTEMPVQLSGVSVNAKGQASGNEQVRIDVYRLDWSWWWDAQDENLSSYVNREYSKSVLSKNVRVKDGIFSTPLNIEKYGRYFIRATHPDGHTSGTVAYFGGWSETTSQETASMLHLSTDKKKYKVGETIKVSFPSSEGAVAIVSFENGKTISQIQRIPTQPKITTFELKASSDMCPNTYVAISLIQPYDERGNDRPIRLYGVVNVNVEDPSLHLNPAVKVPSELRPSEEFTIEVTEKEGRKMNYTVAIVDEGLLSLTAFKTPDPFPAFYAREALGVKTWDFYDYIFGAYGARLDKAFAVGGDESLQKMQDEKTNRFKPVVLFDGPFTLEAGKIAKHTFKMPEYIGEVRTTIVAATNGCYGSTAVNTTVNRPLMLSVALPRLLTPGDMISIPVTVFAMKDHIREVKVKITTDDKITLLDGDTQTIQFDKKGEKLVWFQVKINQQIGVSSLVVEATSGNEHAKVSEDIQVRVPNPRLTKIEAKEVQAEGTVQFNTEITGSDPQSILEISSIPSLNLEQRLSYLLEYPHGCVEQITSKAFPQLSLPVLLSLTAEERLKVEEHVRVVIHKLRSYQTSEGGFAYWSGGTYASEWGTTYAVNFLISAQQQGYSIPVQMLQNATNYIQKVANSWYSVKPWAQQEQAYRLFVLALSGQPDMAAMNRLKESNIERPVAQWLLASAYALSNQSSIAKKMVENLSSDIASYRETGGTYGSTTRDNALILQAMVILDMQENAYRMLNKISKEMGSGAWYSTQETSFCLHAAAQFVRKYLGTQAGINVIITTPKGDRELKIDKTIWQQKLNIDNKMSVVTVENKGKGKLFVKQINSYAPLEMVTEKMMSGLEMDVRYYNDKGVLLTDGTFQQGEDVVIEINVKNTGLTGTYQELALSYLVPSGFEIINERLTGNVTWAGVENIDIRDERFYIYFDLDQNQTKTFKLRCNAAFKGEYMQPAVNCSAMYDNSIQAILPGRRIKIN